MKKLVFLFLCLSSLSFAIDYDPVRGEMLSLSCANCHGTDGKSNSTFPYIAGLDKDYLYKTLLDFKTSKRTDTYMMTKHTKGFTDEELEQLSYYFSKVK
ncbi:c-type cytochrome [Aliarcobacter lanthieri]|uniref:c-type cytochrome n=1 Tax=Aliarcobacter lanthieri TaxID=1355374 RepID=UPI003AAB3EA1